MDVVPENQCDGVMQRLVGTFESISCENQMSEVVTEPEKVVAGGPANQNYTYIIKLVQKETVNVPNAKNEEDFKK